MTLGHIIAEIKSDFKSYHSTGLLDEVSMERWGIQALKVFGKSIMTLRDTVIDISNGRGELPEGFFSLYAAYECTPQSYEKHKVDKVLQGVRQWKETVEKINRFNSCNECCTEEEEKIITERVYFEHDEYTFSYKPMGLLKLAKFKYKSEVAKDCRNKFIKENPKEIMIKGEMIYTNYPEGSVYVQYYGLDEDEEGNIEIPDTSRGGLVRYIEDYIKYKVVEKIVLNQDDTNLVNLLQLLKSNMMESYNLAQSDVNFDIVTPKAFDKLKLANAKDLLKYEQPIANVKKW